MGTTDSRLLHSLQVAKMSSEVNSFLFPTLCLQLCYFKVIPGLPSPGTVTFLLTSTYDFFPGLHEKFVPFLYFAKAYPAFGIVQ